MDNKISEMKPGALIKFNKGKDYEFIRALSSGGTGQTILMKDTVINQEFVCKKYNPIQQEYWDEFYERFVDEIKLMYSVYHNNVVRIYDYYLYPEYKTGYIIMEYIQGMDLDEYFEKEEKANLDAIFTQIINAFSYLEKKKILHRDIRAQNVIIDTNGLVKVIDFGFGKDVQDVKESAEASILLNWPASKYPNEVIEKQMYTGKTEIYYVGYLVKNIIEKYDIKDFRYKQLLDKMIQVREEDRISSFEQIQQCITEQKFDQMHFSEEQKCVYRSFSQRLLEIIAKVTGTLEFEREVSVVAEKLRTVLINNRLEENLIRESDLISCFIKSAYSFYRIGFAVDLVEKFYDFYVSQDKSVQELILNSLYEKIKVNVKVETLFDFDEELPFN